MSKEITVIDLVNSFDDSVKNLTESLKSISEKEDAEFADKINFLLAGMVSLVPVLLQELKPDKLEIDVKKSEHVMRINSMLKDISASLYKKREFEAKEEIDVNHPKIQAVLSWVMEGVFDSMKEVGISDTLKNAFLHNFSVKMVGFEETSNKKLKGVSFSKLDAVENPLLDKFNEIRKQ